MKCWSWCQACKLSFCQSQPSRLSDLLCCIVCGFLGSLTVRYCSKHQGHDCDVAHTVFRKDQRVQIAEMLAAGIPFDEVLEKVQNGNNSTLSRLHFITKRDLNNIVREFNLYQDVSRCSDSPPDTWAEEVVSDSDQIDESAVSLPQYKSQNSFRTADEYIAMADQCWSDIRTTVSGDAELAAAICEQLSHIQSVLPTLKAKPQLAKMALTQELVNKNVVPQRCFRSSRRKPTKRKPEMTVVKPCDRENMSLLSDIMVSSTVMGTDHNYDTRHYSIQT